MPVDTSGAQPAENVVALLWTLVRTEFKSRYHGTVLGLLWALLKPVSMFLVMTAVFTFAFHQDRDYVQNLMIGVFLWEFFAESTRVGLMSLTSKGFILSKARVRPWVLVIASCSNSLVSLGILSVASLIFIGVTRGLPGPVHLFLFAVYVLAFVLITTGISLALVVLFPLVRDLNQLWEVATQAGFFLAPIVWPIRILPERFHFWLYLWPPTPVIQYSRAVLVDREIPSLRAHGLLAAVVVVVFGCGWMLYRRGVREAVERL